jgi:hypothetical protein
VQTSQALVGDVSCVGLFSEYGLRVDNWYGRRHEFVGVGASRKILVA